LFFRPFVAPERFTVDRPWRKFPDFRLAFPQNNALFCGATPQTDKMDRDFQAVLDRWLASRRRKPLVLRGARQVGKTWLVRDLAKRSGRTLVEANFERNPEFARYFAASDPQVVFDELTMALGMDASSERSILFLDEIQAAPEVIAKLRWFAEELPELPVVSAGSLLEFALKDFGHSMPVGRIHYAVVEPMSFPEYLRARNQERILGHLIAWRPGLPISPATHEKATGWFDRYAMVGGMPEAVRADREGAYAAECRVIQRDLIQTYRDDFAKYSGRMDPRLLNDVLMAVVGSLGRKFVYSRVGEGVRHQQARHALELLAMARLCQIIPHSSANGLPLAAQTNQRLRKVALLDTGLAHGLWNTPANRGFPLRESVSPEIRGGVTEQLAAQQLRCSCAGPGQSSELFHWRREGGRAGEIDFLAEISGQIVPVEVKSGAVGSMKSLHQFMRDKSLRFAVRLDRNPPTLQKVALETTCGQPVAYHLLNLPHYLAWRIHDAIPESDPAPAPK
jgi:predicted AAA+ superfamily ATPase